MFTFESVAPPRKAVFTQSRHPKTIGDEDEMDWEDETFQETQVAIPGEDIALFQSYMRYDRPLTKCPSLTTSKGPWNIC
jgi:hypothetical protein